jgi:hypothetical protein
MQWRLPVNHPPHASASASTSVSEAGGRGEKSAVGEVVAVLRRWSGRWRRRRGPRRCPTSTGFAIPNVKQTIPHISLAMGQSKNRC